MMNTFDEFREQVQHHQRDFKRARETVLYAQKIISKEHNIGKGQCLRLVSSMKSVEHPLHECFELLATSESLPTPIKPFRHPLLIVLDHTDRLLQDIIPSISSLHSIYKTQPRQQANRYRQHILGQLEALAQSKNDIVDSIDSLLLTANPGRSSRGQQADMAIPENKVFHRNVSR